MSLFGNLGPAGKRWKEPPILFGGLFNEKIGQLCAEVNKEAANLWTSGELSDCTFLVGTESVKVTVAAHKLILAMASPVFRAMFYGGMANCNDPVPIVDVDPDVFKALLKYIYTGNISINSTEEACQLCYAAQKYMMEHIVKESLSYLWKNLNPSNACQLYEFSKLFDAKPLMQKSLMIISTQTKEVLNDKNFEEINLDTIITIFSMDNLNIDSELDLVDAIVRYAKAQSRKTKNEILPSKREVLDDENCNMPEQPATENKPCVESCANNNPDTVTENHKLNDGVDQLIPELTDLKLGLLPNRLQALCRGRFYKHTSHGQRKPRTLNNNLWITQCDVPCENRYHDLATEAVIIKIDHCSPDAESKERIRGAIEKIRFLALTPQEFAQYSARYNLLTDSEGYAVILNIVSETSSKSMPAGLSLCRTRRHAMVEIGGKMNEARSFASFRYTVHNIKNLREPALSPPCYVNNLPWRIKVAPTLQEGTKQKDLTLHLECNWDSESPWQCKAKYEIKLISLASSGSCASSGSVTHHFKSASPSDDVCVAWSEVLDPKNEFTKDGAIIVEAKIEVI